MIERWDAGTQAWVRVDESVYGNPFIWTAQRYDAGVKLYSFYARTYSPELGRWLQRDPLGYVDGVNLYEYVASRPTAFVDPLGLMAIDGDGAGGAGGSAAPDPPPPAPDGPDGDDRCAKAGGDREDGPEFNTYLVNWDAFKKWLNDWLRANRLEKRSKAKRWGSLLFGGWEGVILYLDDGSRIVGHPRNLQELLDFLRRHRDHIRTLYLFGHGGGGDQLVGNDAITAPDARAMAEYLCGTEHVYLMACDAAAGEEGRAFISEIADALGVPTTGYTGDTYTPLWQPRGAFNGGSAVTVYPPGTKPPEQVDPNRTDYDKTLGPGGRG